MNKISFNTLCFLFVLSLFSSLTAEVEYFPIPDILKSNVEFWKKVYSEVSNKEGLLHDRDYPLIIYDKVETPNPSKVEKVKKRRKSLENSFKTINSEPEESWGEEEKRIVALFDKHANRDALKNAADRIRFQRGQRERFIWGLERSGMFLDTIRAILEEYNVPTLLAYLPHVESSFDTEAYSKVGAAGLWQFMRATGASYGMRIDYQVDERRDPIIATRAAARYLSDAYEALGAWPIAITSYNHGVYGMKRAVSSTGSNDIAEIIKNYKSRSFGFASSNFYACFIAASQLAEDYQTFFPDVSLMPKKEYNSITLEEFISLNALVANLGIAQDIFKSFNPAIRPSVFNKNHSMLPKGFTIHVPAQIGAEQLQLALQSIPDSLRSTKPPRPQYHKVVSGENLSRIASRYGISIRDIAQENNLSRLNRIYAGQVLRIPPKIPSAAITAKTVANVDPAPISKSTPPPKEDLEEQTDEVITAREEQPSDIPEGPEIVTAKAGVEIIAQDTVAQSVTEPETIQYKIKRGDNLTHIADRFGITVQQLAETNSLKSLNRVYAGQILNIPISSTLKTASKREEPSEKTPEPKKEVSEEEIPDSLKDIAESVAGPPPSDRDVKTTEIVSSFDANVYNLDASLTSGNHATIRVSLNETIGHYADWLGIPTMRIRQLNNMGRTSDIIFNGILKIPVKTAEMLEDFTASRLEYHMAIEEDFFSRFRIVDTRKRIVKRGENIWDIIKEDETAIPLWLMVKFNKKLDPSVLKVGMELTVPIIEEKT